MRKKILFEGLVYDEIGNPVGTTYVGDEPCYVVDDAGFKRHISSEQIDRQVLNMMHEMIAGNEDLLSEQAAKLLGQDDIFTRAMIETQLKQMDKQYDRIFELGIPDESRTYMGMTGFRIVIDVHGNILDFHQPGMIHPDDE
jgi:hypothetical protein